MASVARGGSDFIFLMASLPPRGTLEPDTNVLPKMNQQTNWTYTLAQNNLHNMELTISWVIEHQETHPGFEWKSSNPAICNQHSVPFGMLHLQLRLDSFWNTPLGMWRGGFSMRSEYTLIVGTLGPWTDVPGLISVYVPSHCLASEPSLLGC